MVKKYYNKNIISQVSLVRLIIDEKTPPKQEVLIGVLWRLIRFITATDNHDEVAIVTR